MAAQAGPGAGAEGQVGVAVALGLVVGAVLLPVRGQLAGAASISLAMRPVAHTLAELAGLLGKRGAVAEHLDEAVEVARTWEAPRWEAEARAARRPDARLRLTGQARIR
jgi:hypothetical protein